jgi:hypothetical protein
MADLESDEVFERVNEVLVEVRDYLEGTDDEEGKELYGKVESALLEFFDSEDSGDDDSSEDEDDFYDVSEVSSSDSEDED